MLLLAQNASQKAFSEPLEPTTKA